MGGNRAKLLVAAAAVAAIAIPGGASPAAAAPSRASISNCTPGSNWGTLRPDLASQALDLINQHRTSMGLAALKTSPRLTASSNWKSLHMGFYGYFGHNDPAPPVARDAFQRISDCGYTFATAEGENIAYGYGSQVAVFNAWMNSQGHRANILNSHYRYMGLGYVSSGNWWCQQFGS